LINDTILFSDQQIDIEALQYIKEKHIPTLLMNFPLGILIKFEHYVEQYQISLNKSDKPNLNTHLNTNANQSMTNLILPGIVDAKKINEPFQHFQLDKILLNNVQGSLILDYYKTNSVLNESCRNLLVEIIINNLITNQTNMTIKLANYIAEVIVTAFPSEIKVNVNPNNII